MILRSRLDLINELLPPGNPGVGALQFLDTSRRILCASIVHAQVTNAPPRVPPYASTYLLFETGVGSTGLESVRCDPMSFAWLSLRENFRPDSQNQLRELTPAIVVRDLFGADPAGIGFPQGSATITSDLELEVEVWLHAWRDTTERANAIHMIATLFGMPISVLNANAPAIHADWRATQPMKRDLAYDYRRKMNLDTDDDF